MKSALAALVVSQANAQWSQPLTPVDYMAVNNRTPGWWLQL